MFLIKHRLSKSLSSLFFLPETKAGASGSVISKSDDLAKGLKQASEAIQTGGREFKMVEEVVLIPEKKYFRGTESMETPFKMSDADIRNSVDKSTDLMKENGVSINTNKYDKFVQKYGGAWEVDLNTLPKELKIKHTSGTHFEIVPQKAGTMTVQTYKDLLKQVKVKPKNSLE